jgi:hypothetical protein
MGHQVEPAISNGFSMVLMPTNRTATAFIIFHIFRESKMASSSPRRAAPTTVNHQVIRTRATSDQVVLDHGAFRFVDLR